MKILVLSLTSLFLVSGCFDALDRKMGYSKASFDFKDQSPVVVTVDKDSGTPSIVGAAVVIPHPLGALHDKIALAAGNDLANGAFATMAGVDPAITTAGPAVNAAASEAIGDDIVAQFQMHLPVNDLTGVGLAATPPSRLAIIYHVSMASGAKIGMIPPELIAIDGGLATFAMTGMGTYQAVLLPTGHAIDAATSADTSLEPVTQAKAALSAPLACGETSGKLDSSARTVALYRTCKGNATKLFRCYALLDENRATPFDYEENIEDAAQLAGGTPNASFTIKKETAHVLAGRIECLDELGRFYAGNWSANIAIPAAISASTASTDNKIVPDRAWYQTRSVLRLVSPKGGLIGASGTFSFTINKVSWGFAVNPSYSGYGSFAAGSIFLEPIAAGFLSSLAYGYNNLTLSIDKAAVTNSTATGLTLDDFDLIDTPGIATQTTDDATFVGSISPFGAEQLSSDGYRLNTSFTTLVTY